MRITEVISEAAPVAPVAPTTIEPATVPALTAQQKSSQQLSDIGSSIKNLPGSIKDWGTKAGQSVSDFASGVQATVTGKADPAAALRSPTAYGSFKKGIDNPLQTADDAVRAAANMATFGSGDKLAAHASTIKSAFDNPVKSADEYSKRYEQEKEKEYATSGAARARSPVASTVGDVGGTLVAPAFAGGAKLASAAARTALKTAPKAVASTGKVAAAVGGGIAADKQTVKALQKVDPNNPYLEETNRLIELVKYRK
jgi:hypothetical protein